jgi:hypothetical protein
VSRHLQQGAGWRLGWDPQAPEFQALVGTDDWAIELTGPEFEDFRRLVAELLETLAQMQAELMDSEAIACEATSERLWLQIEGFPHHFCLSLILHQGRRAEGTWTAEATAALVNTLQMLQH